MNTDVFVVEIPDALNPLVGEADPGTRIFRREGSNDECGDWFNILDEHFGPLISPGGVGVYVPVSRAGVHKRLKAGKLTGFFFHVTSEGKTIFGRKRKIKEQPYIYIPVSECKAWGKELEARSDRAKAIEEAEGDADDYNGDYIDFDPKDKGNPGVKYIHK
jgi:hypothetical protein